MRFSSYPINPYTWTPGQRDPDLAKWAGQKQANLGYNASVDAKKQNDEYNYLINQLNSLGLGDMRPNAVNPNLAPQQLQGVKEAMQRLQNIDLTGGTIERTPEQQRAFTEQQYQRVLPSLKQIFDIYSPGFKSSNQAPHWDDATQSYKPIDDRAMWYETYLPQPLLNQLEPFLKLGQLAAPSADKPWDIFDPAWQPPSIPW